MRKRDHFEALLEFGIVDEILGGHPLTRARRELAAETRLDAPENRAARSDRKRHVTPGTKRGEFEREVWDGVTRDYEEGA